MVSSRGSKQAKIRTDDDDDEIKLEREKSVYGIFQYINTNVS